LQQFKRHFKAKNSSKNAGVFLFIFLNTITCFVIYFHDKNQLKQRTQIEQLL